MWRVVGLNAAGPAAGKKQNGLIVPRNALGGGDGKDEDEWTTPIHLGPLPTRASKIINLVPGTYGLAIQDHDLVGTEVRDQVKTFDKLIDQATVKLRGPVVRTSGGVTWMVNSCLFLCLLKLFMHLLVSAFLKLFIYLYLSVF